MKILFVGNADELAIELKGNFEEFESYTSGAQLLDVGINFDVVIIQDTEIPIYELRHFITNFPEAKIFYQISHDIKQIVIDNKLDVCKELGVVPIRPRQSIKQMAEYILLTIQGIAGRNRTKKIVSIMGTHSRNGTTQTVLGIACMLKEITEYSVVVLSLNTSNPPNLYFQGTTGVTLDDLYTQIDYHKSVITSQELKNLLYEHEKGFFYLGGNQDFTKRNHYHIDDIGYLIDMLYKEFDLILIDAGHDPDTTLTIQALQRADLKFLNVTQHPIASMLWRRMNEDILGRYLDITPDEFMMIVNFYSADVPGRDIKTLESEMGMPEIARIPDCGMHGILCEINRGLLYDSKAYKKILHREYRKLAMHILQRFDLLDDDYEEQERKSWLKR